MRIAIAHSSVLVEPVAALRSGICEEASLHQIYRLGAHAITLALLSAARRIAEVRVHPVCNDMSG